MITEETLKRSAEALETELNYAAKNSEEARELISQLEPFISEAKAVVSITDFGFRRLRFDRPFIEGPLAENHGLSNAYAKFANQFEGLEV